MNTLFTIENIPITLASYFFIALIHSSEDFPVVITSSITTTLDFFFILKPLLKQSSELTLSKKIDLFPNISPTLLPIIMPPIAGDTTKSISSSLILVLIKLTNSIAINLNILDNLKLLQIVDIQNYASLMTK